MSADGGGVLQALHQRFLLRAAEDLQRLRGGDLADPADLQRLVHRLAGAAGTFGHPEVSAAALQIDEALARGEPAAPSALTALISALEALPAPAR